MTVFYGGKRCPLGGVALNPKRPPPCEKTGLGQPTKVYSREVFICLFFYAPPYIICKKKPFYEKNFC